jgi:DNA polymerase-3 subunit delta'
VNWDLVGHDWAVELLKGHLVKNDLRQAYLFSGPPGVGRRTLGLRFAQAVNCSQTAAPGDPCRTCRTCRQIERQQYSDLYIVQVEEDSREIKIDQVRALQHWLSLSPYESRYRIALLLGFQNANQNAQNALLKTLEEAPDRAILLLTADTPEDLLPTIASRCEILRLRPLPLEDAIRYLASLEGVGMNLARRIAHLSAGRIGYARQLVDHPGELERWSAFVDQLLALLGASRRERFAYAEEMTRDWRKSRDSLSQVLHIWLSFWRDVLLCSGGSAAPLVNQDKEAEVQQVASTLDFSKAIRVVRMIEDALLKLDQNANTRLLAEVVLLDMPHIKITTDEHR